MRKMESRCGSALLIVLGMLAFMIVSAVAFSAYMRYSRLPSSYLRRTSATRQLVKAALARAIDEVDRAVANNPHPGLGTETVSGRRMNYWKNRVYFGTNAFVSAEATVPVLTLEGLAYIPPPLVNEARYYSRRSPAAAWKSFGFDAGRYAFCALDVSDYFDVNRLAADRPRASADNQRISLSYMFENHLHTSAGSGAQAWDNWLREFRTENQETLGFEYASKVPLVSVADMNLALGESGHGGFSSPFCKYLNSSGGTGFNTFGGEQEEDLVNRMTFVTDSWFPASRDEEISGEEGGYADVYDLTGDGQPFEYSFLNGPGGPRPTKTTTVLQLMASAQKGKVRLLDSMPVLGLVALYDYLDVDRVPMTLAAPTLERAPMVCALKPNFNSATFAMKEPAESQIVDKAENGQPVQMDVKTTQTRDVFQTVSYFIDPGPLAQGLVGGVEALFAYPFAHKDETAQSFGIDGRAALFFTVESDPMKLRTRNPGNGEALHLNKKDFMNETPGLQTTGVITLPFTPIPNRQFGAQSPEREEDAVEEITLQTRDAMAVGPQLAATPLMTVTYKWTQTWTDDGFGSGSYAPSARPADAMIEKAHCGIPPLKSNGETNPAYSDDNAFANLLRNGGAKLHLNAALWVRVTERNGKTVDLVPAHMKDDLTFNQINNVNFPNANTVAGEAFPVMRFGTGVSFTLSPDGMTEARTPQTFAMSPAAVMVDDPRFNHAPESWYSVSDATKNAWLQNNRSLERNGDVFMATSDQGYLQSIYELAFLPRFSDLQSVGANGPITGDYANPDDGRAAFGAQNAARNEGMMWRSYRPYGANHDDFEGLGFTSAGRGYKINPYTDSTNVLMAAFANTPVDWRLASTNDASNETGLGVGRTAAEFNAKYAWNEYCSDSVFKWDDLTGIAGAFMSAICPNRQGAGVDETPRDQPLSANWRTAWRDLWRDADNDRFGGYQLENTELWSVDRKFLYGYWSDCFATRQQLFLVFVRAEPLMMGGGAMNRIPPQLGARAVALVWRDPTATRESASGDGQSGTGYPHRTRVLFYKQLD